MVVVCSTLPRFARSSVLLTPPLPLTSVETLEVLVAFTVGIRNAVQGADWRISGVSYALNKWNVSLPDYSGAVIQ